MKSGFDSIAIYLAYYRKRQIIQIDREVGKIESKVGTATDRDTDTSKDQDHHTKSYFVLQ